MSGKDQEPPQGRPLRTRKRPRRTRTSTAHNPDAVLFHEEARARADAGDLAGAAECLERALRIEPTFPEALILLGDIFDARGIRERANEAYTRAYLLDPFATLLHLGYVEADRGDTEAATLHLTSAVEETPRASDSGTEADDEVRRQLACAWFNLGFAQSCNGDLASAVESYRRSAELCPECEEVWYNLGDVCLEVGEYEAAIEAFDRALRLRDDDHQLWNNQGTALSSQGDNRRALECYRWAVRLDPAYHPSWNNMGNALVDLGQTSGAIEAYERAIALAPDQATYHVNLASALSREGRCEEALGHLARAVSLDPEIYQILPGFPEFLPILSDPRIIRRES